MAQEPGHAPGNIAPQAADPVGNQVSQKQYVINLCDLPAPITVPQPRAPRLARYSFFLSHAWKDGRRQYRLHMGYFHSMDEAQKWLVTLERVYPNAHVSDAPETQPDLISSTQRLRVLQIGHIGDALEAARDGGHSAWRGGPATPSRLSPTGSHPAKESYVKPAATAQPVKRGSTPSLEETLEELRASEFDMGAGTDEDLNSTGVRHLRFEIQRDEPNERPAERPAPRARR
jgi:hypothetical protein